MTDQPRYPTNADEATRFLDALTFDDTAPVPELPGVDTPTSVSRTVRIPFDLNQRIRDEAEARGITDSDVIREWLALGSAATQGSADDNMFVSRAEVQRAVLTALATLHTERRPA